MILDFIIAPEHHAGLNSMAKAEFLNSILKGIVNILKPKLCFDV